MKWGELNAKSFAEALEKSERVCVLPIGVIEKHGDHLPLGTDVIIVREIAKRAAEIAPAVVFPCYYWGQIAEARHVKGTIAASHRLIMDALLEMCDEMYRNGFTKIVILNGHGGNSFFLPFFAQEFPRLNRPYSVYIVASPHWTEPIYEDIQKRAGAFGDEDGHGGFFETSLMMHLRPDLVHMGNVNPDECLSLERLRGLQDSGVFTGFNWYSMYPHHIAGDPRTAAAEFGAEIFEILSENAANVINKIKADKVTPALIEEYNKLGEKP
jgi:creatinine amidohydrolase